MPRDDVIAAAPVKGEAVINITNTRPGTPNPAITSDILSKGRLSVLGTRTSLIEGTTFLFIFPNSTTTQP